MQNWTMSRKVIITFLVLSVVLSGCTHEKLSTLIDFGQEAKPKTWQVNGNSYTTTIKYEIPAGEEENVFTVVLEKGIIKDVIVGITTEDKTSIRYQTNFSNDIKPLVIGKKLSELESFDRVSGATYTTDAFNNALAALKEETS